MNDIQPPRRPQSTPQRPVSVPSRSEQPLVSKSEHVLPTHSPAVESLQFTKKPSKKRWIIGVVIGIVAVLLAALVGTYVWYESQLRATASKDAAMSKRVTIESGSGLKLIASTLKQAGLIRNETAFDWYLRLDGSDDPLQAGSYVLNTGMNTSEIVKALQSGKTETITVTFLPGGTVSDDKKVLIDAGFAKKSVDAAFTKRYDHPVFASKPASADLEGYIYGETYQFPADVTVEAILTRTFDELYAVIQQEKLVAAYEAEDLSLYQGITMASIIQREVPTPTDQKQVAQVFLLRLKMDISLGSDVTYQYAADKAGVARDPKLDSPYNTRVVTGLPPGPIAAPGKSALLAVAQPAEGDYLFFLSGDDDVTYFGRTQAEHEQNIIDHCAKKCQIL